MTKIFKVPFATQGDRTAVPDEIQADGSLSYTQGYGYDYERDQVTDPAAKDIEREKMNGLFHDITEAVGEIQAFGVPVWAEEGKPYAIRSIVYHDKKVWQSKIENNETEPAEGDDWAELKADMTAEDVGAQAAGYSYSKTESDNRYQPKGNYAPAGNYAVKGESYTRTESDGRYQPKGSYQAAGYSYSKTESDNKYQPKGTYADGDRFSTRTSAVLMSSPNGNYGVEISNTGMFAVADLSGAAPVPIFRVTPTGEINDGSIALAKVTGAGTAAKSDILQTTGASTANVMSQKAVTDAVAAIKVFGAGQRWSDVKSTRNLGVNYTNTSGRTIALFASTVPATTMASLVIYVDGVTVSNSGTGGSDSGFTRMASGSAIIPAGSTYRVEANSLDKWSELR
ncbi:hypothetical protein [Morganella morganii]|uniref:hypothetical protein n=1 Tax=Morganella morganii TaxID=582 RepID=UPI00236872C7|nr:hypothetical protein [Morganella morganii]